MARPSTPSRQLSRLLALFAAATPAGAQTVVFHEGFENGFASWNSSGLWNAVLDTQPCVAPALPLPDGVTAAWYGSPASCNFQTGTLANTGRLELSTWIQLPNNVGSVTLYFDSYVHTEYCRGNVDVHTLEVIAQNGPDGGFLETLCLPPGGPYVSPSPIPWHERRVDLTAYRGAQVRLAFTFASVDGLVNYPLGWLVDDVRIVAEPGTPYCPSAHAGSGCPCSGALGFGGGCAHSLGSSATLLSAGVASVAADSLSFTVEHLPPGSTALLFQGTVPITTVSAFGDGLACVSGVLTRLGIAPVPGGTQTWPLAGAPPLSVLGGVPAAGGDRCYQVFFRDAAAFCTSATFNLTSAERVVWSP